MKYRTLRPFIAFGKTTETGDIVELTPEQAASLESERLVAPYEIKIEQVPEHKKKRIREPSESAPAVQARHQKMFESLLPYAEKL